MSSLFRSFILCLLLVYQISSRAWTPATWMGARTVFVAGATYRGQYEWEATQNASGVWQKPDKKFAVLNVRIHLTNISPVTQTVKVVLATDTQSGGAVWNRATLAWHPWGQWGFFIVNGGNFFMGDEVGLGYSSNLVPDHSLATKITSGDIVLSPYNPTLQTNNMQTVSVIYYQGGNINTPTLSSTPAAADIAKSFARAPCEESGGISCYRSNIYFSPQIQISVKEDRGAVLAATSFSNNSCTASGTITFSAANTTCLAQENGPPMWIKNEAPTLLLNGGRPF